MLSLTQTEWNPDSKWAVGSRQTCLRSCKLNNYLKSEHWTLGCRVLLAFVTSHQRKGSFAGMGKELILPLVCNQYTTVPCSCGNLHPEHVKMPSPVCGAAELWCHFAPLGQPGQTRWCGQGKLGEPWGSPKSWFAHAKIMRNKIFSACTERWLGDNSWTGLLGCFRLGPNFFSVIAHLLRLLP